MRCAVVDPTTGLIENVIVADPETFALPGKLIVADPDGVGQEGGSYRDGVFLPAPEPEPQPIPVPEEISRRQFCQGLAVAGMITKPEAIAFIQGSALPAAMQAIIDGMTDEDAAFEATMLLLGAGSFFRSHPLVLIFAMAQSMTETQVDDFWRLCASL